MSDPSPAVRQRASKKKASQAVSNTTLGPGSGSEDELLKGRDRSPKALVSFGHAQGPFRFWLAVVTILAFLTRFYKINHPNEVVFDEVHFGKVCI
jgi:dolichyl-phosphate-mannose-protein mannosyltransferase